ncbi:MAG: DUF3795 domain-containing protein [Planctomycetes bacterium]|nr:DUF3795 domain-containing protein [Planctomycetota bacterium]
MDRRKFLLASAAAAMAGLPAGCAALRKHGAGRMPLACCGLDCGKCEVLQATLKGDREAKARLASSKVWADAARQHWGKQSLAAEDMTCYGCQSDRGPLFLSCRACPIRKCCKGRGLANCGKCVEWRTCAKLARHFKENPEARENLLGMEAKREG